MCFSTILQDKNEERFFEGMNQNDFSRENKEQGLIQNIQNNFKKKENSLPSKFDKNNNQKKNFDEINNNEKLNFMSSHNEINKNNIFKKNKDENIRIDLFDDRFNIEKEKQKNTEYMKIVKANTLEFKKPKSGNKDNNGSYINNDNNKILFEEFLKKENDYKLKIKELKDVIANYEEPILIGLNNIGATCYMNATLQCLSNTKKLTDYFLNNFKNDAPNKIMTNEYYKVIKNLWNRENNKKSYSPNSFKAVLSKENPLFAGIAANDSKDLINFLLERFHQELNVINKNINTNINNNNIQMNPDQTNEQMMFKIFLDDFSENFNSPISNLFYGILETKSQCKGCNIIKYNFQVYSFLEFPLQQVNQFFYNKGKRPLVLSNGKNPDVDIYECFEYYGKIDLMTGENQMHCDICNRLCDAYYSTIIYSCPNYLIINLNRGKGATYECNVIFPEQLNVINYTTFKHGITAYELYAVICHLGPSSMSGHFVAYCKNRIDNKWYLYNDSIVSLCERKDQYNDGMPYILFYKVLKSGKNSEF